MFVINSESGSINGNISLELQHAASPPQEKVLGQNLRVYIYICINIFQELENN